MTNRSTSSLQALCEAFFERKALPWLALLLGLLFLATLNRPFSDPDVLIYADIGRAIYAKGVWPFDYIFDHKPIFTYYLYGLLAIVLPDNWPKFQIASLVLFGLVAWLIRSFAGRDGLLRHFLIFAVLSVVFLRFSANTELFTTLLSLLCLWIVWKGSSPLHLLLSGAVASAAFNTNYLAFFLIGPGILYLLYGGRQGFSGFVKALTIFAFGFAAGFLLAYLPYFVREGLSLKAYFEMQSVYLAAYKAAKGLERPNYIFFLLVAPLFLLVRYCIAVAPEDRTLRTLMGITFLSAFVGAVLPGKFYLHYAFVLVAPAVVLFSISTDRRKYPAMALAMILLTAVAAIALGRNFGSIEKLRESYDFSKYRDMKAAAGEQKVLSVGASHVAIYYARLVPAQPFIWNNHVKIVYQDGADDFYQRFFDQQVPFVVMPAGLCAKPEEARLVKTCAAMARDYAEMLRYEVPFYGQEVFYRRR